eukprot:9397472-Alexandrium_andersonii.AAC.1
MSASLVGSEMCIRDSTAATGCSSRMPLPVVFSPKGPRRLHRQWHWWPVSYTHLTLPTICSV